MTKVALDHSGLFAREAAHLMSHDLRNLIAVGFAELAYVLSNVSLGSEEREAVQSTLEALGRANDLVENFVSIGDYLLVGRGEREWVELAPLFDDARTLYGGDAIVVTSEVTSVHLVRALLVQQLNVLLRNACRHGSKKPVEVVVSARPASERGVVITISNFGAELPPSAVAAVAGEPEPYCSGIHFCRLACAEEGGELSYRHDAGWTRFIVELDCPRRQR